MLTRRRFILPAFDLATDRLTPIVQPATPSPRAFMERALELARLGAMRNEGTPYGCVIVKDNRIAGEGWNRATVRRDGTAHAEIEAIQEACRREQRRDLSGYEMYTNGRRPCPMCETAAYWARIDRIFTAVDSSDAITDRGAPKYGGC